MKKLVAAVLTGVLVAGTLSTGVYAKDDDKTSQLQRLQHHMQKSLKKQSQFLRKKDMIWKLLYLMTM